MERKTRQRDIIKDVLTSVNRPLSPKEILESAQKQLPSLGIATVYRALKDFLQSGIITEVELPGSLQRYEMKAQQHHHHFWCRRCDRVFKVEGCPGTLNFQPPQGFKTEIHEVTFRGLCATCVS